MSEPLDPLFAGIAAAVTGGIAWHALSYRDEDGERPWVHVLFGCIALLFFFRFVMFDLLGVGG